MNRAIGNGDFLHCDGKYILNEKNEEVLLRGTNLGGWLLQEQWMASYDGVSAQWDIVTELESRFGKEKARALINRFEDNFITEYDLDILKDAGFSCLRVPFWYRNFQSDDNGTYYLDENGEKDFSRLKWIVEQCKKRGMYVILDMHGVPGHQSIAHHCCRERHCRLYDDTKEGENFRNIAAKLWRDIASVFKDEPAVAAYDLMNEPMCEYKTLEKNNKKYREVYDLLYKAVREVDKKHIITLEAIWTPLDITKPKAYGWENVMYQYHTYLPYNALYTGFVLLEKARAFNVPVIVGEFSQCRGNPSLEHILKTYNKAHYNWCSWTYKGHSRFSDMSNWFIKGTNVKNRKLLNLKTATYDGIYDAWGDKMRTENGFFDMNDIKLLGKYARMK